MLNAPCSRSLLHRPVLVPSPSKFRVSNRPPSLSPLTRSSPIFAANSRFSRKKWKISCFRHEDFSSQTPNPEYIEHSVPEELVKPENKNSTTVKRDWTSAIRKMSKSVYISGGS